MPEEITEVTGEKITAFTFDEMTPEQRKLVPGRPLTEAQIVEMEEKRKAEAEVNRVFNNLFSLTASGHQFTDEQLDIAMSTIFARLEAADVVWIKELSSQVASRPIWQLFAGWFKLLHERGETTAAIYDTEWQTTDATKKEKTFCAYKPCGIEFVAERAGQKFHSSICGARQEKLEREQAAPQPTPMV